MNLFRRLFCQTTQQPCLPSDVLLSMLTAKLMAEPDEAVHYDSTYGFMYETETPSGKHILIACSMWDSESSVVSATMYVSSQQMGRYGIYNHVTPDLVSVDLEAKAQAVVAIGKVMRLKYRHGIAQDKAYEKADAELLALDVVEDLLGVKPVEDVVLGMVGSRPPDPEVSEYVPKKLDWRT